MSPNNLKFRLYMLALAVAVLLLAIASYPAYAAGDLTNENCVDCGNGKRKPGNRSRDLAMLASNLVEAAERMPAGNPDFPGVNKLKIQSRPGGVEVERMQEGTGLLRTLNQNRSDLVRLRGLLPEKFRVADGSQFQKVIDDAILKMVDSEAGKQAICVFSVDSAKDVQMYLSASSSAAAKVREACSGRKYPDAVVARLRYMRQGQGVFQPTPAIPAKQFKFIFSESGRTEIEGYTAKNNTTFLILSPETMTVENVSRTIAHEIAISYDQLARLGYLVNPATIEDMGVNLAFGLPNGQQVFAPPSSSAELNKMKCAFRDPAIRYAASTQRAYNFEDSTTGGAPIATKGTCGQILAKNSVLLKTMAKAVSWDTGSYQSLCGMAKNPKDRLNQVLARIKTVENSRLKCVNKEACGGKSEMSLCELILNPRIGPHSPDLDGGGPRPGMGGGWDGGELISSDQGLMERLLNGASVSAKDAERLGDRLNFPNIDDVHRDDDAEAGRRP